MAAGDKLKLLSLSWNQTRTFFSAGTNHGFQVFESDPCRRVFERRFPGLEFHIIETLFRTGYYALVGTANNPQFPDNRVVIWNETLGKAVADIRLKNKVRGVRLRRDHVVVVLKQEVSIYNWADLRLIERLDTAENEKGLCCVSHNYGGERDSYLLVLLGLRAGQVMVKKFGKESAYVVDAHESQIAQLGMTADGSVFATASVKGTLIRVFNSADGTCLKEVRRGTDKANINSIDVSGDLNWLLVSSANGTIHVFSLDPNLKSSSNEDLKTSNNKNSSFSFMKAVLPRYFSSEWSFAKFSVPAAKYFSAVFGRDNCVLIVGMDGSFHKCTFDAVNGGIMTKIDFQSNFLLGKEE